MATTYNFHKLSFQFDLVFLNLFPFFTLGDNGSYFTNYKFYYIIIF